MRRRTITQKERNLFLANDILKYYPARSAKTLSASFHTAISYSTAFISRMLSGEMAKQDSTLKLSELKISLTPILNSLKRAEALEDECQKQAEQINEALEKIRQAQAAEKANEGRASTPEPAQPTVNPELAASHKRFLSSISNKVLKDFETNNQVLIPIASDLENEANTQMLCEMRKQANGEILFLVWNTGIGTSFHVSQDDKETSKTHAPVRVFRCANAKDVDKKDLTAFFENCLAPSMPNVEGKKELKPEELYSEIIGQISFLTDEEIDSTPFYHTGIVAEPGGSSAWKVVETFIHNCGLDKDNASEIDYEILKHTFENLLTEFEEEIQEYTQLKQEIEEMASLFAAKLLQVAKEKQFSIQRQTAGLNLLARAKELIREDIEQDPINAQDLSRFDLQIQDEKLNNNATDWVQFDQPAVQDLPKTSNADFILRSTPVFNNIDDINKHMLELLQEASSGNKPIIQIILQLESVLKALPLTEEFVKKPHLTKVDDFALTLQKFVNLYMKTSAAFDRVPYGERQIAVYSAIALLELLANQQFVEEKEILENLYSNDERTPVTFNNPMPGFLQSRVTPQDDLSTLPQRHQNFERSLRSHYFTTTDKDAQERLRSIQDILRKHPSAEKSNLIVLDVIASKDKALLQACGRAGNSDDDNKKEAGFYLYEKSYTKAPRYLAQNSGKTTSPSLHPYQDSYRKARFCLAYKVLSTDVNLFLGGMINHRSFASENEQRNWEFVRYDRDINSRKLYSEYVNRKYIENEIENAHHLNDANLISDLAIKLASQDDRQSYSSSAEKLQPKLTSNNIQIKLYSKTIDKKIDSRRIFSQMGVCPEAQIVATIEYLQANATNIDEKDTQQIIFMLLFDKGLMAKEMKENPAGILILLNLIGSGIKFYSNDDLKQPLAFYFKINAFLRKSLLTLPHDAEQYADLLAKTNEISQLLDTYQQQLLEIDHKSESQSLLLKDLQAVKTIDLNNQLTINGKLTEEQLVQFYVLNFQLRFAKELVNDKFLNKEVAYAQHALKTYALANPKLTTQHVLLAVVDKIGIDFNQQNFQFAFPNANSDRAKIDLINATVINQDAQLSPLPKEVYANDNFREIFGNDDILAKNLGHDNYEFQYKGETYRLHFANTSKVENKFVIQKQMAKEKGDKLDWYQLKKPADSDNHPIIPGSLMNSQHWIWGSQDGDLIVVDKKTNCKKVIYVKREKAAFIVDEKGSRSKQIIKSISNHRDFSFLCNFEKAQHIEVTKDLATGNIHINLPRYGLKFSSKMIQNRSYFVSDDDQDTCLLRTNSAVIEGLKSTLVFASVPKENELQKVVKTLLAKQDKKTQSYATYYHAGTEFEPASAADAYYLSLLTLSYGKTEKGYQILSQHVHRFLGSSIELDSLLAIANIGQSKENQAYDLGSLNKQGAKILACYIIVQYLNQGHTIDGLNVQEFKQLAANNIKEYLVLKNYLPKSMRLKQRQELAIINFVKKDQPDFYLDIQNKRKQLKSLLKEHQNLLRLNAQQSPAVNERLKVLENQLFNEYSFIPTSEQLVIKKFDLTNRSACTEIAKSRKSKIVLPKLTINDLSLETSAELVNKNIIDLFQEAAPDPIKMTKLNHFLDSKLIALVYQAGANKENDLTLNLSEEQRSKLNTPDFIKTLIKNLNGIKVPPKSLELPEEAKCYALLRAMIADKRKVSEILRQFESRETENHNCFVTNSSGDSLFIHDVNEAIHFALSSQSIQFDIPTIKQKEAKATTIRFVSKIENTSYFNEKLSVDTPLTSLDSLLGKLGLKNQLTSKEAIKSVNDHNIFSGDPHNNESFYHSLINESNQDYAKGCEDTDNQRAIQDQWFKALDDDTKRKNLKVSIQEALDAHQAKFDALKQNILTLLNKGPSEEKAQLEWKISLHAKTRKEFTLDDAFIYFSNRSLTEIKKKCHLDAEDAKKLLQLTAQYLVEGTQQQQYQRILTLLAKLEGNDNPVNRNSVINLLGMQLTLQRCYDFNKHPDILLFEFLEDKLVYPNQISMLDKLLKQKADGSYESVVIQIIMGGGKSKILLPLLAKLRANGTNLTIIEVPQALLETNFYDLHAVSNKLNQNSHLFKFDRNVEADSSYYYRMRQHLHSVMVNKEYIVTTRESIQSLELKYIDLLTNPIEDLVEWEKQITYLDDIVNMIKNRGDAILDEIDLNLRTRDQLIYTVGEGKQSPEFIIKAIIGLYQSFAHVDYKINGVNINLHDVLTLKTDKPSEEVLNHLLHNLKTYLLEGKYSPIKNIVGNLKDNELKDVENFLSNKFNAIPDCIKAMPLKDKSILAVYKEHLNRLLPVSLNRKLNVNFGLTQDEHKMGIQREIAIPYLNNDKPNESAKFQNHLLTMNYTIQTHFAQSLSTNIMQILLKDLKSRYMAEITLNVYAKQPTHQVENLVKEIFEGKVDLATLDINDQQRMDAIYEQFKDNHQVKEYCLTEHILPKILSNPLTMCSNDQNHVSSYRSTVGFTGTDYNYRCFHDSIVRDNKDSFGTDGQTISHLIKNERTTHILDKDNSDAIFNILNSHESLHNVRAIKDAGAVYKGVSNREVANNLARFFYNRAGTDIKHILYFNKDNLLCALKVSDQPDHEEPLVLGSSENIEGKLGCDSSQRFTYYDQDHTTGTDILQGPHTIGITTVSEKSMLRDILQAVMRLRDLKGTHRIEFAVMRSLVNEYPRINKWDVKAILNVCLQYQAKTLMQEHLSAAFNKISNVVREDIMGQIRSSTSIMDKAILSDAFKQMLYQFDNASYFDKYGVPESMIETEALLKIAMENAIGLWRTCLHNAQRMVDSKVLTHMESEMSKIITKSVQICAQKQLTPLTNNSENQVIAQMEVQNQNQNEVETQQQVKEANYKERSYRSWKEIDLTTYTPGKTISLMSFEQIAKTHGIARNWKFDANLYASENYYETCSTTFTDKLNQFKKPLFYVMNVQVGKQVNKILITQKEAGELRDKLKNTKLPQNRYIWIDTPSGVSYAGKCPAKQDMNPQEQRLMEQIQFFNADVIYFAANYGSLTWFKENAAQKFDYLQNELLTLHPSKSASMPLLKEIMLQDGKLKSAAEENEHTFLTDKSWQRLHDAYFYPQDDNHPEHTKEEYKRLQDYARHRDHVKSYSISSMQAYKKALVAFFSRTWKVVLRKAADIVLQYNTPRNADYISSKKISILKYGAIAVLLTLVGGASWLFGLGIGSSLMVGSMIGASILVLRNIWCLYAKSQYDTITKIEKLTNPSELEALQSGLRSKTYRGYWEGLLNKTSYYYPKAYYAGLEIGCDKNETILEDVITNTKISNLRK